MALPGRGSRRGRRNRRSLGGEKGEQLVEKGEFVTVEEMIGVTVVLALLRCDEDRLCRSKPSLGRKVSKRAKRSARCFRAGKGEDAGSAPLRVGPSFGRACGVQTRLVFCVYCSLRADQAEVGLERSVYIVIYFIFGRVAKTMAWNDGVFVAVCYPRACRLA